MATSAENVFDQAFEVEHILRRSCRRDVHCHGSRLVVDLYVRRIVGWVMAAR